MDWGGVVIWISRKRGWIGLLSYKGKFSKRVFVTQDYLMHFIHNLETVFTFH